MDWFFSFSSTQSNPLKTKTYNGLYFGPMHLLSYAVNEHYQCLVVLVPFLCETDTEPFFEKEKNTHVKGTRNGIVNIVFLMLVIDKKQIKNKITRLLSKNLK